MPILQPWAQIESTKPVGREMDPLNEVRFVPIKASAVHHEVEFSDLPCSIREWLID
jgi:hypothetical protein